MDLCGPFSSDLSDLSDLSDDSDWLGWVIGRVGENKKRLKIIRFPVFWGAQERTIISVFKNGLLLVNNLIHKLLVLY